MSYLDKPAFESDEKSEGTQAHLHSTAKPHVDGNVHLVDNESGAIRLVPIPSKSPRDPLNWSMRRKVLVTIACCWYSIMSLSLIGGAGPLIPFWIGDYASKGVPVTKIINLTTWPSAFVGVGNFIFIPLALWLGRRFSLLISSIVLVAATIGAGASKDYDNHMVSRIFQGLATGVTESLLPLILTDITYVHQRGRVFAFYWVSQSIASSVLSIASSYEAAALGWRSYYWIFAGTVVFGFLLNFFLIPETRFFRPPATIDGQRVITDAYGEQVVVAEDDPIANANYSEGYGKETDVPLRYFETLKPWNGIEPGAGKLALGSYWAMAKCLTAPGMLWSVIYAGVVLGVTIAFSLSYATVLTTSYGFSESQTGLIQISTIPAGLLALAYTGFLTDKLALRSARKHGGMHKPESRLPILIFPSIVGVVATVLYGFCAQYPATFGNHWIAPFFFTGAVNFGFVSSLITTTTFAVECVPQAAGPALVVAVGLKNIVAFGLSYGLTGLVFTNPPTYAYSIVLAPTLAAVSLVGIPVYYFNPIWRKKTTGHVH